MINWSKETINGLTEAKRLSMSPEWFIYYSNAKVVKKDKYLEEITISVDKPTLPSVAMLGQEGYYPVGDFNRSMLNEKKKTQIEEKRE